MAWFFRAIERSDSRWACRHGTFEFDDHAELGEAIAHLRQLASESTPAELFVHRLDGSVERLGEL